jgi:hypothetical protein
MTRYQPFASINHVKKTTIIMKNKKIINMVHDQYMITCKDTNDHLGLPSGLHLQPYLTAVSLCSLSRKLSEIVLTTSNYLDQYDKLAYLIIAVFPTGMLALLREV